MITYKPFFRDIYLGEDIPSVRGYRPKYKIKEASSEGSQKEEIVSSQDEDIEEEPVESDIIEIRERDIPKTHDMKFSSKKEFQDTMIPLYRDMLIKSGLNPEFAKSLVVQDGLESAWGKKPAGKYNFGGIKGKGSIKRTREVINGKDVYINDSFRDFESLEDYIKYKINLLNSKKYKAFDGEVSEFADRVFRGRYATDPRYVEVLNKVIASVKNGGVLKFQDGGSLAYGKEWVKKWLYDRKGKLKENYNSTSKVPIPIPNNVLYRVVTRHLERADGEINPNMFQGNVKGRYIYPPIDKVYLKEDDPTVAVHEFSHASIPEIQTKVMDKIIDSHNNDIYHNNTTHYDEYLDNRDEMYSRMMQFREWAQRTLNYGPDHVWTTQEIDDLKNKYLQGTTILDGKLTGTYDKEGKPLKTVHTRDTKEYKFYSDFDVPRETRGFLDRYNSDVIKSLLNDVAYNNKSRDSKDTVYAEKGTKLNIPLNVLPEYLKPSSPIFNRNSPLLRREESTLKSDESREGSSNEEWTDEHVKKLLINFEGNREDVYYDPDDNLTAGIGHKLTKEEQELYPFGTILPDSIREKWWINDFNTAKNEVKKYYGSDIPDYQRAVLTMLAFHGGSSFIRGRRDHKGNIVEDSKFFKKFEEELKKFNRKDPSSSLDKIINEMQYKDDTTRGMSKRYGAYRAIMDRGLKPSKVDSLMYPEADSLIGYKSNKY